MANNRIYYACETVGFADFVTAPTAFLTGRGVQTVGLNTVFNLEQFFEFGQVALYQNVEGVPDVTVTLEKVLDGHPLLYHLLTQNAPASTLVGRSNQRANVAFNVYGDSSPLASGAPQEQQLLTGVYVSQLSYDFGVNGAFKESVTAVGNNRVTLASGFTFQGFTPAGGITTLSPAAAGGVAVRQSYVMANCKWPKDIRGISSSGTNDPNGSNTAFAVAVQSVKISANLGRQSMLELGRRAPFFRYVDFPVEVTCAIEVTAKEGDHVDATELGQFAGNANTQNQAIYLEIAEGTKIDLGTKNRLASVNYNGANAAKGGGNATTSYSYTTFSDLDVKHSADPTVALRA